MFTSLPERMRQDSIRKLIEVAKMIESGKVDLISGCRDITRLRNFTDNPSDDIFTIFILLASNPEIKIQKDLYPEIQKGCRSLINKFA